MKIMCSSCQANLNVADSYAGKRGKCPKCGAVMQIPEATSTIDAPKDIPASVNDKVPDSPPLHPAVSAMDGPATESQKKYATTLGITFQPEITKGELGKLLGAAKVTDRQKEYAISLGIDFPTDISKVELGKLISAAVEKRDEERFSKLDELQDRESKAYQEMREEIMAEVDEEDSRLSKASPKQMVTELENRGDGAILVSFNRDQIDFDDMSSLVGAEINISFSDNLSEAEMRTFLFGIGALVGRSQPGENS
jgi:phage FluMu protein Com